MESKIRPDHLDRYVYVYIRQSTILQVRKNTTSTLQQYELVKRAIDLGWSPEKVIVIDCDQARSASTTQGRDGFKKILSEVAMGSVGAVMSLKGDRLSRDSYSWHKFLKFCELSDTLVIDEAGIYDPCNCDDRLMLGIKGVLSEAEAKLITRRMISAKRRKAETGELHFPLPVGYIYDLSGKTIIDPDEEVQSAIKYLFDLFDRSISVRRVVRYFNEENLLFPTRIYGKVRGGEIRWVRLRYARAAAVLHNPAYAGTYVYGRTTSVRNLNPEDTSEVRTRSIYVSQDKWMVQRLDNHEGYISWKKFLTNQDRIRKNRNVRSKGGIGAIRVGEALLQGIAICGICGHRMQVAYPKGKKNPSYFCLGKEAEYGASKRCQSFPGGSVDEAISQILLDVIKPAQLKLSISALRKVADEVRQSRR